MTLQTIVKPGKTFYDYDSQLNQGFLGIITDAVKLSLNCVCILGSETSSRAWCVAALCGAMWRHVPLTNVTIEGAPFELVVTDPRVLHILSIQAPAPLLRPVGIGDQLVPDMLTEVLKVPPMNFALADKEQSMAFLEKLLSTLKGAVRYAKISPSAEDILAGTGQSSQVPPSQILNRCYSQAVIKTGSPEYAIISCDHEEAEAVAVSRIMYRLLCESRDLWTKNHGKLPHTDAKMYLSADSENYAWKGIFIQDYDLEPAAFDELVCSKQVTVCVVLMTVNTLSSATQLLRLGHMHKFANPCPRVVPVSISDSFGMPGKKVLDDIESGKRFESSGGATKSAVCVTTREVSNVRMITAIMDCLEHTISLIDVPRVECHVLKNLVHRVFYRTVHAAFEFTTAKPVSPEDQDIPSIFTTMCKTGVKSRLSTFGAAPSIPAPKAGEAGAAPAEAAAEEEIFMEVNI